MRELATAEADEPGAGVVEVKLAQGREGVGVERGTFGKKSGHKEKRDGSDWTVIRAGPLTPIVSES